MKPLLFIAFNLLFSSVWGQQTTVTAGGSATLEAGSISYTIGQILYTSNFGESGSINQGVQQPYEIFVVSRLPGLINRNFSVDIYPNPVESDIVLRFEPDFSVQGLYYIIYSGVGAKLETKPVVQDNSIIQMSGYEPGIYFLKVYNTNSEIITFKIIKK